MLLQQCLDDIDCHAENLNIDMDDNYRRMKNVYNQFNGEEEIEILWRMARSAYKAAAKAELKGDKNRQKSFLYEGIEYASKAAQLDINCTQVHAWRSYLLAKLSEHVGKKERIELGYEIQQQLEHAISLRPNDGVLYYTYGRWCMEVAKLSYIERKLAQALLSKPPDATYEDAIEKFQLCARFKPDYRANYFYMAKCYISLKQYKNAIECLDCAVNCVSRDEEDLFVESEMYNLHKKYASYR